ncbi:hypothetical protein OG481_02045 [Streptomyces longwoodensis]|uniref:hypothetical protein n=1 Tax=Streptomyces longwoodensis TaxID=68231 RepID=UPI002DD8B33F|nr:hypothetical protein [Streptomyces longwoodensis]WRY87374.1 hypothetical protein OG481_02045 [Streptomyces longwoodensis]
MERTDQPTQQPSPAQPWPIGVVACYLTDAGKALANPDLAVNVHTYRRDAQHTLVTCSVCPWQHDASGNPSLSSSLPDTYCEREANQEAHAHAQAHAEKCRALPRPEAQR